MESIEKNRWWIYLQQIREVLFGIFFFFMPFTQALTFNIGFPLKISELTLLALSFLYISFEKKVKLPKQVIYCLGALFSVVTVSLIINLLWDYPYALKEYPSRFGYNGDSISRYVYFILAICAFFISVDIFLTDTNKYIRIWIMGAIAAAIYGWYLMLFSTLQLPVFLLPGMEHPPQTIGNGIIRCGTFLEGNYMALYLLISAGMSFYIQRFKTGFFLLASIFTTFATLGIVSIAIYLAIYFRRFIFRKKFVPLFIILLLALIYYSPYFTRTSFYKEYIYEKLFSDINNVNSNAAYSKADRLITIRTALNIAQDNITFGVGLSNFGRHYDAYYETTRLDKRLQKRLQRENSKVIPNNIYAEILTETGIVALAIFLVFLFLLLFYTTTTANAFNTLFPTILCMMLCFNAYPSFIMIYLWASMALPIADYIKHKKNEPGNPT